jgi:SAM-dependent methyltransferase
MQTGEIPVPAARESAVQYFFPEVNIGGFTRIDSTMEFYSRINALVTPEMTVLDYGAGRGGQIADEKWSWRKQLKTLHGKCARLIGVDVDDAVRSNPYMDETHVIPVGGTLPVEDGSVDLIYSDWVFEHVTEPKIFVTEIGRALRRGGWVCARTPNRWGYIGIGTNLVPNSLHTKLLRVLQPDRKTFDVFPTAYKINTRGQVANAFPAEAWDVCCYGFFTTPAYFANSRIMWALVLLLDRLTPSAFAPVLMIFARKK